MDLFPGARLDITPGYSPKDRVATGHGKQLDIYQMIEIHAGETKKKMHVYGDLLRGMIDDQVRWIRDRSRQRRITDENSRISLAMACAADDLARQAEALAP